MRSGCVYTNGVQETLDTTFASEFFKSPPPPNRTITAIYDLSLCSLDNDNGIKRMLMQNHSGEHILIMRTVEGVMKPEINQPLDMSWVEVSPKFPTHFCFNRFQ